MGRRRSRRRSMRHERKIEHRQWFTTSDISNHTVTLKAGTDSDNLIKLAVTPFKGDDQTILRTRGFINVYGSTLGTPCNGILGATVLPNRTANEGTPSDLPNPFLDADGTDWFVWHPFAFAGGIEDSGTVDGADVFLAQTFELPVDSKAKRIMEAAESVVWVMAFEPEAAVTSKRVSVAYCLRTLVGY